MFRADLKRVAVVAVLAVAVPIAYAKKSKRRSDLNQAPTTSSSTQPSRGHPTPPELLGKWMYGSISPTTYWDASTGAFTGNARGSAGIYEFDEAGRYKEYIYLELRTGNYTNKAWTFHEGAVTFADGHFTLHVERGHYQFWINGKRTTDRDMTPEERTKLSKGYAWTLTKADDGAPRFTVPFADGSKMEYRRPAE